MHSDPTSPAISTERFSELHGLRAVAALLIFFHHVGFQSAASFTSPLGGYLARMDIGVPLFFSLSGFLLFRPMAAAIIEGIPLRPTLDHLWRRALRIYPAFWVALLVIVAFTSQAFADLGATFSTFTLTHIHWPSHVIGPMPQAWSLATEITFYASLPLLARLARPLLANRNRAGRVAGLFGLLAGCYAASLFFRLFVAGMTGSWTSAALLWLPALADYFAIGMALATAHVGFARGTAARRRLDRLAAPAGWWLLCGVALFVVVAQGLGLARGLAVASWPREMLRQFLYGAIGFTLLFPLVFGDSAANRVRRWARGRSLGRLGTISYSIYLWHMVFIVHRWSPLDRLVDEVWDVTVRSGWFDRILGWTGLADIVDSRFVVLAVVAGIPTLVVSTLSYRFVERPAMAQQRRLRRRLLDPTPTEALIGRLVSGWRAASFQLQLGVIAASALLVRVGYVMLAKRTETLASGSVGPGDQFYYSLAGDALADGRGFVVPWHDTSITLGLAEASSAAPHAADHPPLTALLASLPGLLPGPPGSHVLEQRLTMALLGVVAVVLIGLLARAVAGPGVGLVAAALAAVHAGFWVNDGLVMAETLMTLTTAAALLSAVAYNRNPSTGRAVVLGCWVGLAVLTRAEALLLVPLVVAPVIWTSHRDHRIRLSRFVTTLALTAALLAPWVGPNLVRFAEPVFLSTNDGTTLVGANNPQVYGGAAIGFWSLEDVDTGSGSDVASGDQSQVSSRHRRAAFNYARDHLERLPLVVAARVGRVWSLFNPRQMFDWNQGEGRELWASLLAFGGYLVLVPAAAVGWLLARRARFHTWPLSAMFIHVTLVAAVFYGLPRLRVPAEIALVVLAAIALQRFLGARDPVGASLHGAGEPRAGGDSVSRSGIS